MPTPEIACNSNMAKAANFFTTHSLALKVEDTEDRHDADGRYHRGAKPISLAPLIRDVHRANQAVVVVGVVNPNRLRSPSEKPNEGGADTVTQGDVVGKNGVAGRACQRYVAVEACVDSRAVGR